MKAISIIVLCHNNHGIHLCIRAAVRQLELHDEIIIVNDHSDIAFLEAELYPCCENTKNVSVHSVTERQNCRSHNRNYGAKLSKNEILLFIDGDIVLVPGSLDAIRTAHEQPHYTAFFGHAHGMRFSTEQLALYIGRSDYQRLLESDAGITQLCVNPLLADWRIGEMQNTAFERYYWILYYTCLCTASREAFFAVDGFDESLIMWGSEDIDLGYKLSQLGRIGYLSQAHGIHIPHPRNLWNEHLFDRDNLRYLLDKYRKWPFELFLSFDISCEIYHYVELVYQEIIKQNFPRVTPTPTKDTVWINVPTPHFEHATTTWVDHSGNKVEMPLLGLALPCCDQRFEASFITENVFSYPIPIVTRILQEALRISRRVWLIPSTRTYRAIWDKSCLERTQELFRSTYASSDLSEFQFEKHNSGRYEVTSLELCQRLIAARSHCPILLSAESRKSFLKLIQKNCRFILVDFTQRNKDELKIKIEHATGIQIEQFYQLTPDPNRSISLKKDVPPTLMDTKAHILFIVDHYEQILPKTIDWYQNSRFLQDYVIDLEGMMHPLGSNATIS